MAMLKELPKHCLISSLSFKQREARKQRDLIFSFSNCTVQMKVFVRLSSQTDSFESIVFGEAYFRKNRKWKGQFHAIKKQMCLNPITLNNP